MNEFFLFNLIVEDKNDLIIKFVLLPLLTLFFYYLSLLIFVRIKDSNDSELIENFLLKIQFSRLYSVSCTLIILNFYWFYLLFLNGINKIDWAFTFNLENIYLQLLPFLLSLVVLIIIYVNTKKKINEIT
jgi:hypothetical protein